MKPRTSFRLRHRAHVLFLFLVLVTSSCLPKDEDETRTLVRVLNTDPETLDLQKYSSTDAGDILRDIGEGLVGYSVDGQLLPAAAEKWSISGDGLTYEFRIRPDARWSNGDPVVAQNFVDALQRLANPETNSPNSNLVLSILNAPKILDGEASPDQLGVKAKESKLLEIVLSKPTPYFLSILNHPSTFPVWHANEEQLEGMSIESDSVVSNGAYKIVDRITQQNLTLKRNEYYWGNDAVFFDSVIYRIVDTSVQGLQFRAGEIDISKAVDKATYVYMQRNRPSALRVSPGAGTYYYGIKVNRAPFAENVHLRRAFSLALDREAIVEAITGRGEIAAYSMVPPSIAGHRQQTLLSASDLTERRNLARTEFEKSGYAENRQNKITLRYTSSGSHDRIAVAAQEMWRDVLGVEVILQKEDFKTFLANLKSDPDIQLFWLSWVGQFDDPEAFLEIFESSSDNNFTGYSSDEFDSYIAAAGMAVDPAKRKLNLDKAESVLLKDSPFIPIYFYVNKHLVDETIVGFSPNLFGHFLSKDLERVSGNE